jgi:hypothetical protein
VWTHRYKNNFIQGYCDRDECHVLFDGKYRTFRSYQAAQIAITKALKVV